MDLSFAVHKLAKFSANPGKVQFEGFIHLLGYIRDNKTLGLKYYAYINDAPITDILRQANIKTKNHLTAFSEFSWQDCPDTGRSTGAYIILYQCGYSSPRKEKNSKPPTGGNVVPREKTIKVNPNGGKQGGIPVKEYTGIANTKSDPNRCQTESVPRHPRANSNEDPSGSNSEAPAKA